MTAESLHDVLIACIGNELAGDDAAGCEVFKRLERESLPAGVRALCLGLSGMALLDHLQAQRLLVIVDAVQLGGCPGSVHILDSSSFPSAAAQAVSLHGIGLSETFQVARELYPENLPKRAVLIGIEGRRFNELGVPLSAEVESAMTGVVMEIKRQIAL